VARYLYLKFINEIVLLI